MSSFGAKKVVRTYSRHTKRQLYDEEPPTKRRRVETGIESTETTTLTPLDNSLTIVISSLECERESSTAPPSSPKDSPAVFSDEPPRSSPPSSPAPRSSPPPVQKRRPVFSIFKKQLKSNTPAKEPFAERSHNAQSPPKPAPKKKQMTRKTCKTCGMQYIPSNAEDAALHKKFHAMNLGGVDFTKPVVERFRKNQIWSGDGSFIAVVGRKDTLAMRNRASDVLKVVNTELAATSRTAQANATERTTPVSKPRPSAKNPANEALCVGACLAERIWEAYKHGDTVAPHSSSISISTDSDPVALGISRIWTSSQQRKKGIATRLLESARSDFIYGLHIEKARVAFSQPTESGGNLARKWSNCLTVLEDVAPPSTGKTKKSVRILSPTTTIPPPIFDDRDVTLNELMARRSSQGRPASPPPPVTPAGFVNNSVTAGEANAQVIGKDAMAIADAPIDSRQYFVEPQAPQSSSTVPANPFSRTLASLEPQDRESDEERTNTGRPILGNSRASLDVESFKNLLLTGKPTPRPSGPPPQTTSASQPAAGAQFETSSSTDTSSVSRQSLFEPIQESHVDSPRTSVDMVDSDEDESMGLVSDVKKGKKKPPPAPKHRHGKLVTQRQPQTPTPPPAIRRTDSSDTNKPLPPTPVAAPQSSHISTQDTTPLQSPPIPPIQEQPSPPSEGTNRQKKAPPPVPLARSRSRSSSNLTISSQHSVDAVQSPVPSNVDPFGAKSPPRPPPSRHGARLANLGNSSANSSSTELPQRSKPPSSRRSTLESQPSSPAPSRNVSGESTGSNMPPPPPPPRRRSNRSSLDQQRPQVSSSSPTESRRTSTEYRRTSTDSLRREYAPVDDKGGNEYALYSPMEESEKKLGLDENMADGKEGEGRSDSTNILDDMEKFQREIDELRTKYKQAG
ncbi:hypothetical protein BKA58DRAFT_411006 [Alternaria rosae]|uniref:uncharacterized protein n=1 Tax=Alternaria rosae TaxID=1187941 RepID=UPI001E8D0A95|nr:uncharacterized protein BKA58DRAFT_411006 [Alternaria rosae]KAH6873154.1 hypothetical protein BKA58DRAFT_411006 [Alternaria rosae]